MWPPYAGFRILLAAGLNTDLIREVLPCMAEEGAILAPTCEEMAQDLNLILNL